MNIASLQFDTHKVVKLLLKQGFTEKQAEGILETIREVTIYGVATKEDVTEVQEFISEVRAEFKNDIRKLENTMLKYLIGHGIAVVGILVALSEVL